jgi:hypothetical protein
LSAGPAACSSTVSFGRGRVEPRSDPHAAPSSTSWGRGHWHVTGDEPVGDHDLVLGARTTVTDRRRAAAGRPPPRPRTLEPVLGAQHHLLRTTTTSANRAAAWTLANAGLIRRPIIEHESIGTVPVHGVHGGARQRMRRWTSPGADGIVTSARAPVARGQRVSLGTPPVTLTCQDHGPAIRAPASPHLHARRRSPPPQVRIRPGNRASNVSSRACATAALVRAWRTRSLPIFLLPEPLPLGLLVGRLAPRAPPDLGRRDLWSAGRPRCFDPTPFGAQNARMRPAPAEADVVHRLSLPVMRMKSANPRHGRATAGRRTSSSRRPRQPQVAGGPPARPRSRPRPAICP